MLLYSTASLAAIVTDPNMNGDYLLAPTPKASANGNWSTQFKDYPGGVESFDIYAGPVTSTYGEVFWTSLPEVKLPEDIIKRFKGKGMALVGFEVDQVRKTPEGDVSLPINLAYNHHYGATLLGEGSRMERVPYDPKDPRTTLLTPEPGWDTIPVEHTPSPNGLPTSLWNGYSNGGEFRKSYHAIPPPYAQIIESPNRFHMTPMQIDTWNREKMNLTGGPFIPGPYPRKGAAGVWPKNSTGGTKWPSGGLAPAEGVDATYSALLECPLTTRIRKQLTGGGWDDSFTANIVCNQGGSCPKALDTADGCFAAAKNVGIGAGVQVTTNAGSSASHPSGCSVQVNGSHASVFFNTNAKSEVCCGAGVSTIAGEQDSLVSVGLSLSSAHGATITLTGPADGNWFGVGFDTHYMANSPYTITVDGNGDVTERVLGDHTAGIVLNQSVTVVSHGIANGVRKVVMTRPLAGLTGQHHTFDTTQMSLDFISAIGSSSTFGYHKNKTVSTLALWPEMPAAEKGGEFGLFEGNVATADMRNDWDGEVGYEITPTQLLTVTSLGRAVSAAAPLQAAAKVSVWDTETKKVVATAVVGPEAGAPVQGFAYTTLAAAVVLQPGRKYYITQTVTNGMPDKWTNWDENAKEANTMLFELGPGVYSLQGSPGVFPTNVEATSQFAGIVTLKAKVAPNSNPAPVSTCICSVPAAEFGKGTGTLKYLPTGEVIGFPPRCEPYPRETVLRDKNPTCDIRTYVGGLSTCHHGWHLLDADQEVPWQDQPLLYYFKWRFYFQEYHPERHISAYGWNTGIGGNTAEYDVPQCAPGTPVEQCTHEITGVVTPPGESMHFIGAHYHCHAPTCLSMEIYNNITGELLCKEEPYHGQGADTTPGGDRFDEEGYIAQRVCLWGNSSYGLQEPPMVSGVPLFIKAVTNSTYGHHGEMALPQMLVADTTHL